MDSGLKINPIFNYPRNLQSLLFAIFNMYYVQIPFFFCNIKNDTNFTSIFINYLFMQCEVKN